MDVAALRKWLAEPRSALIAAVSEGVRDHIGRLRSRGINFYGYALLPGEPYDIHSLVAVTNTEADIKVPRTDGKYCYYRYCIDEWKHWDHDGFAAANALLVEVNERFKSMHAKHAGGYAMDKFEVAHANALLDAVVRGLVDAKHAGVFGRAEPFLAVWISDSGHPIITGSVHRLNPPEVAEEFMKEFG
jgi:hypothetical protein